MNTLELTPFIRSSFDHMVEGVLYIDRNGYVLYANEAYLNFIHMKAEDLFGKKLRDIRPHAQLPSVVESGRRILHAQRLEGLEQAYFVNMYPVYENGEVTGGLSIITFMDEAQRSRIELENYERSHKELLHQVNKTGHHYRFENIIANAPQSQAVKAYARHLAEGDMTVLLEAESGTGKEMYAQAIHNASPRKNEVFLAVNCAGFSKEILDSELFGYTEGAFTGARKGGKIGLFQAANGGTLFLDEIAEMDFAIQAKLLRALQERKIRPVGSVKEIDVDVRIICACNVNLEKRVEEGTFRQDLYYRINTFPVRIPPLRDRREDIPPIVMSILNEMGEKLHRSIRVAPSAMEALMQYSWPGNVRELRNVVEFSAYMSVNDEITVMSLPEQIRRYTETLDPENAPTLAFRIKKFEQEEIRRQIQYFGVTLEGKKKAAKVLGISLATLYNKLK